MTAPRMMTFWDNEVDCLQWLERWRNEDSDNRSYSLESISPTWHRCEAIANNYKEGADKPVTVGVGSTALEALQKLCAELEKS